MWKTNFLICGIAAGILITGCGHQHSWDEATCTAPKTCSACGETEGEPLGHQWVDADCENPKTCSRCGETDGEAQGHTTDLGVCSACGMPVNFEKFNELSKKLNSVSLPDSSHIKGNTVDQMYKGCVTIYDESVSTVEEYKKIIEEYGGYEGAADLIESINDIIDAKPSKPVKTEDGLLKFFDEMESFMMKHEALTKLQAKRLEEMINAAGQ